MCERDLQCGGFTFKGSKKEMYVKPEVYFFHFINESSSWLTTDIKYPHWTSYIVGSRDHIIVSGSYPSHDCMSWRTLNRYEIHIFFLISIVPKNAENFRHSYSTPK